MAKSARRAWGSTRKLPSGRYQARYTLGGVTHRAPVTFEDEESAELWLDARRIELKTGIAILGVAGRDYATDSKPRQAYPTVKQWSITWLADGERSGWSPSTIRTHKSRLDAHILPYFGEMLVRDVKADDVRAWWRSLTAKTETTRQNTYMTLSALFTAAVDNELIDASPVKIKGLRKRVKHRPVITATPGQIQQITQEMPPPLAIAVTLGCWCSMRYGEIAALERQDIDLKNGVIHITKNIKRGVGGELSVGPTKSEAGTRTVVMPPPVIEAVKEHLQKHVLPGKTAKIVHMLGKPDKWLTNKSLHCFFDPACHKAGLENFRFHDLRHTGLTMAARAGATVAELMHRAGHSDVETAMVYQHATMDRDKDLATKMMNLD